MTGLFQNIHRGELVVAKEYNTSQSDKGTVELKIKNAEIIGKTSVGNKSNSNDINTIGIQIEFENTDTIGNCMDLFTQALTTAENSSHSMLLKSERWNPITDIFPGPYKNYGKENQFILLLWDQALIVAVQILQCIYMTRIRIQKLLNSLLPTDSLMQKKQDVLILTVIMENGDIISVMQEG